MKIFCCTIFFIFTFIDINASDILLKTLKDSLFCFLKRTEVMSDSYAQTGILPDELIYDTRFEKKIEEGANGIFIFGLLSSYQNMHFLLIDNNGFEIINMREPLDRNLSKLVIFLKKNDEYSKEDILFYISEFVRIKKYNDEINSDEGIIM